MEHCAQAQLRTPLLIFPQWLLGPVGSPKPQALSAEGPPAGLAGSQPHTYRSQSCHTEKCHQGQSGLQHSGSMLPVKVGVNVPWYHQLRGHCSHLPNVQQDQKRTGNSSL